MPDHPSQEFLFRRIRELLPPQASLSDTVAEILHLSSDSAYRRIRGETPLILDEARQLCDHFHLSLDQLFALSDDSVHFHFTRVHHEQYTYEQFLQGLLDLSVHINRSSNKEIIYLTKDMPLFHNFYFRPLAAFRYFFWMKNILYHPDFTNREFEMGLLPAKTESLGGELARAYTGIPSVEIWNTECVNSTISQIEFCRELGLFPNAGDILAVYESLEATILHIRAQVAAGYKFMPAEEKPVRANNFRFFYNRIVLGDNTILVKTGQEQSVFLNYNVLNYIHTPDAHFCAETGRDLQNLMRKSTQISQTAEKQRNIFFNILLTKIGDRKRNLM